MCAGVPVYLCIGAEYDRKGEGITDLDISSLTAHAAHPELLSRAHPSPDFKYWSKAAAVLQPLRLVLVDGSSSSHGMKQQRRQ